MLFATWNNKQNILLFTARVGYVAWRTSDASPITSLKANSEAELITLQMRWGRSNKDELVSLFSSAAQGSWLQKERLLSEWQYCLFIYKI